MTALPSLLALRFNRRIVAAVVISNDAVSFRDSRYFRGPLERAEATVLGFVDQLLADLRPSAVALCGIAQVDADVTSQALLRVLVQRLEQTGLPVRIIAKADVLASWGLTPLQGWTELRTVVQHVWPELAEVRAPVRPYISDAAAVSLFAQCRAMMETPEP